MNATLLQGDARQVLRRLPEGIVRCAVTSPPYYGLRDYGLPPLIWGGDPLCSHQWAIHGTKSVSPQRDNWDGVGGVQTRLRGLSRGEQSWTKETAKELSQGATCACCGAWRGSLGLEPTPSAFVAHLVEVLEEVKRVLTDDGTLWLNLGSSFVGSNAIRERHENGGRSGRLRSADTLRAGACDSDGTARRDYYAPDAACRDLCDGCQGVLSGRIAGTDQQDRVGAWLPSQTGRDSGRAGSVEASPVVSAHDALVSTTLESALPRQGLCSHCANCGACLAVLRSSSRDAQLCARRLAYTYDTDLSAHPSVFHRSGTASSDTAYGTPLLEAYRSLPWKAKDMLPIPWLVALALVEAGWYLRSDIIWAKGTSGQKEMAQQVASAARDCGVGEHQITCLLEQLDLYVGNPMPESVKDRPARAHEYVFLLSKSQRYFYDDAAVAEEAQNRGVADDTKLVRKRRDLYRTGNDSRFTRSGGSATGFGSLDSRNLRSVWTIPTKSYKGAHFAVMSPSLAETCVLAGSEEGDLILDPFCGSGTTGEVALKHGRSFVGIDLNRDYLDLARTRLGVTK